MGNTFKDKNKSLSMKKGKSSRRQEKRDKKTLSVHFKGEESTYNNLDLEDYGNDFEKFNKKGR